MTESTKRFTAGQVRVRRVYEVECDACDVVITDVAQGVELRGEADRIRREHIESHRAEGGDPR